MVEFQRKDFYSYEDFLEIMRLLRAPGGCPWDREQTHSSIRRNFLEETYEVLDAIDHDDASGMCEELGDVLMQVAFHAQIEAERGRFTMANVVDGVARKLAKYASTVRVSYAYCPSIRPFINTSISPKGTGCTPPLPT